MHLIDVPFTLINWDELLITKLSEEEGQAWQRSFESGNVRIRLIEYSPGYKSDHWCCRGHIIHILDGEVVTEFRDGVKIRLKKGMTCCFSDNEINGHRILSRHGAFLLIID